MEAALFSGRTYESPVVLRAVALETEGSVLTASVHEKVVIQTTGHEVKNVDWSESPFNHTWE